MSEPFVVYSVSVVQNHVPRLLVGSLNEVPMERTLLNYCGFQLAREVVSHHLFGSLSLVVACDLYVTFPGVLYLAFPFQFLLQTLLIKPNYKQQ